MLAAKVPTLWQSNSDVRQVCKTPSLRHVPTQKRRLQAQVPCKHSLTTNTPHQEHKQELLIANCATSPPCPYPSL